MMNHVALTLFLVIAGISILLFYPHQGIFWRWQRARRLAERVHIEDALKHLHTCDMQGMVPSLQSLAGALGVPVNDIATLISTMETQGFLRLKNGSFQLLPTGRELALHVIRAHRLFEQHLAEQTGYAQAEWHRRADRAEHALSPLEIDALAVQLNFPTHDPHGDPIPTASGELITHGGQPLPSLPLDTAGQIVHLEDEPDVVYAQLVAEGLHPGMPIRIIEKSSNRIRFWANGDEHLLAPIVANNISVVEMPPTIAYPDHQRLSSLSLGESASVVALSAACRGSERRRFLDLGIIPGTEIHARLRSPGGDPTAYEIRGALIALRREQANMIYIEEKPLA